MFHLQEPLHRQFRFDRHVRTLRETHLVLVSLYLLQKTGVTQVFLDLLADIETIHAHIQAGSLAQRTVIVKYIDRRQIVFLAQHIVVYIVCRGHFQTARTKLYIHVIILDHRNLTAYQRNDHFLSSQMLVLRVVRVDTHRRISHNRLRTGSSDNSVSLLAYDLIAKIVQLAMLFLIDNLLIGQGRQRLRVPIHHTHAPVDQALLI